MNAAQILAAFAAITLLGAVGSSDVGSSDVGSSDVGSSDARAESGGLAAEAAQVNAASQALIDGKLDDAIAAYESLAQRMPSNHSLTYNRGLAHYRKGDLATARGLFAETMNTTDNDLAAKASFNLGNCDYADAINVAEQDRPNAIESLRQAITHYRSALRLNSNDSDARANIELASQMIEKLQEQEKQQEQEQQQQQEEQEQQQQEQQQQQSNSEQQQSEDQASDDQQSDQDQESQQNENGAEEQDSQQNDSGQDQSDASDSDSNDGEQQDAENSESEQKPEDQSSDGSQPTEPSDDSSESEESDHDDSKPDADQSQQQASRGSESPERESEQPQESQNNADQAEEQAKDAAARQGWSPAQLLSVRNRRHDLSEIRRPAGR